MGLLSANPGDARWFAIESPSPLARTSAAWHQWTAAGRVLVTTCAIFGHMPGRCLGTIEKPLLLELDSQLVDKFDPDGDRKLASTVVFIIFISFRD